MRRNAHNILVLIFGLVIGMSPLYAGTKLTPDIRHLIGGWGSIGYSGMLHNRTGSQIPSGFAPTLGIGYRFFRNEFIFQTGVEGQYSWMTCVMPQEIHRQHMVDADENHEPFLMTATISDRREVYQTVNVQVPLYVGYEKDYVYALAGLTIGMNMYGTATTEGTMTTQAVYDRLIGIMEFMPNHGLAQVDVKSGVNKFHTNINVMAHAEIGGRLDKVYRKKGYRPNKHNYRLYLGAFVDYGFLNVHQNSAEGELLKMDYTQGVSASVTPLMMSTQMLDKKINPLVAGVKFTAMFELPKPGKSHVYDSQKVQNGYIKRGANQSMQ